jgi:hypothetical protein
MIASFERSFGDITVRVVQLPAMKALRLYPRLAKVLGSALRELKLDGKLGDISVEIAGKMLESFGANVSPDELENLVQTLLGEASVTYPVEEGQRTGEFSKVASLAFAGQTMTLMRVVLFALEVNFADFWRSLPALQGRGGAASKSPGSTT